MIESSHHQFEIDTRADLEVLSHNEHAVCEQVDAFAWRIQQAGHLSRGEFDKIDRPTLIDVLTNDANQQLYCLRSRCCDIVELLLLLTNAPAADKEYLDKWKADLSLRRIQFSKILSRNPSMRQFLKATLNFGWRVGRMYAAMQLHGGFFVAGEIRQEVLMAERLCGDWINRLPLSCPWSPAQILGYDASSPHDALTDPHALPFDDPKPSNRLRQPQSAC